MKESPRLFMHSARHTPVRRILARLRSRTKALALSRFPEWSRRRLRNGRSDTNAVPARFHELPPPLIPIRSGNVSVRDGCVAVTVLSERVDFSLPMRWRAPLDVRDSELWEMTLHYMEYLHLLPDELFARWLRSWIDSVEPYEHPRDLAWFSFTVATRAIVWSQEIRRRHRRLEKGLLALVSSSLYEQIRFLRRNLEVDVKGNHLVRNIRALCYGARVFDGEEPEEWGETAWELLQKELSEQILGDGGHFERSPAYHAEVLADLIDIYSLLAVEERRRILFAALQPMVRVLREVTGPGDRRALFNDGGEDTGPSWSVIAEAWDRIGGSVPAPSPRFGLVESGFYGARAEDSFLIVQGGPIGSDHLPAHAHGDIFSFEYTVAGRPVIVDSGTFEYAEGEMRRYCRGTAAHNTLTVDGIDQAEFWRQFRVARRYGPDDVACRSSGAGMEFRGVFRGYAKLIGDRIRHSRTLHWGAADGRLSVRDHVSGTGRHLLESRIHLHPDIGVERDGDEVILTSGERIGSLRALDGEIRVEKSWYCPRMGEKVRRSVIVLHREGRLPASLCYEIRFEG